VFSERFEEIGMKHNPVINFRAVFVTFYLSLSHTHTRARARAMFTSLVANPPRTQVKHHFAGRGARAVVSEKP
jgi:hypothetical protein